MPGVFNTSAHRLPGEQTLAQRAQRPPALKPCQGSSCCADTPAAAGSGPRSPRSRAAKLQRLGDPLSASLVQTLLAQLLPLGWALLRGAAVARLRTVPGWLALCRAAAVPGCPPAAPERVPAPGDTWPGDTVAVTGAVAASAP